MRVHLRFIVKIVRAENNYQPRLDFWIDKQEANVDEIREALYNWVRMIDRSKKGCFKSNRDDHVHRNRKKEGDVCRIATWNINGVKNKLQEVVECLRKRNWTILRLQETRVYYQSMCFFVAASTSC